MAAEGAATEGAAGGQAEQQFSGLTEHQFTDLHEETPVHFQIIRLEKQLFVWMGTQANMGNLCLAMPTRMDPTPTVTTLLPGPADSDSSSMAQRLAKRTGLPVAASVNLPASSPTLKAWAERRLVAELDRLQLSRPAAGHSS